MSYPTGGSGYNAPQPQQPTSASTTPGAKGLPDFLVMGVAGLGIVTFFLGFLPYYGNGAKGSYSKDINAFELPNTAAAFLALLLAGGLLAGLSLLPKQDWKGPAAALSIAGFLGTLFISFSAEDGLKLKVGAIAIMVLGFAQSVAAVVAVLFESGLLKPPAPKPQAAGYPGYQSGAGYPQQQGYPQAGGYSQQQGQQYPQQPGYPQQQPGQQYPQQQPGYPQQQAYGQPAPGGYPQQQQQQQFGTPPTEAFPPSNPE